MKSYKVEVLAFGERAYCSNGLRFETIEQAEAYGCDLASRWTMVDKWRAVEDITPAPDQV